MKVIITESKLRQLIEQQLNELEIDLNISGVLDSMFGGGGGPGIFDDSGIADFYTSLLGKDNNFKAPMTSKSMNDVDKSFAPTVKAIMNKLRSKGHDPILGSAYRSPEEQKRLMQKGKSKTKTVFGYHVALDGEGNKAALAVDLVDSKYGWGDGGSQEKELGAEKFFQDLGEIVNSEFKSEVQWGGNWSPKEIKVGDQTFTRGWDPAHIETKKMTMAQSAARTKKGMEHLVNKKS